MPKELSLMNFTNVGILYHKNYNKTMVTFDKTVALTIALG